MCNQQIDPMFLELLLSATGLHQIPSMITTYLLHS
jgi:hypothetical protein